MIRLAALIFLCASVAPGWAQDGPEIGAQLFNGTVEVAGSVAVGTTKLNQPISKFACRTCHQRDGLGGSEAKAPAITWEALSAPTAARPAYDAEAFRAALSEGVRAGGGSLNTAMPRYSLSDAMVTSLIAYLNELPSIQKRGIEARSVTFGVAVPADNGGPARAYASMLREALQGQPDIFGRAIRVVELDSKDTSGLAAIVGLVPSQQITVADFEAEGVPVLFPLALLGGGEDTTLVKGMIASQAEQIAALIGKAKGDGHKNIGLACLPKCQMRDQGVVEVSAETPLDGMDALVIAGADEQQALELLARAPKEMSVYAIAGEMPDLAIGAEQRGMSLTLSDGYGTLGNDGKGLLERHARKTAQLLREALVSSGRQVTRNKLIAVFERKSLPEFGLDYARYPLTGTDSVRFLHTPAK